jgi:ubiquinone/menaquinone biosynthesis C-methylase UbiE
MSHMNTGATDFHDVTEMAGEPISVEQLKRLHHRYAWAASHCAGRDVVELACGTGPGLGLLRQTARSFEAGDYSSLMVESAQAHYGNRIIVRQFDAQSMPYPDKSQDVLIIFEAIYYLRDVHAFIGECRRVLRPGGKVLIATANKDLADFNPSPHSHKYLGVTEFEREFGGAGFAIQCYGYMDVSTVPWLQRLLRPVKRFVVASGLMPKTMAGKRLLKRMIFGRPVVMPAELTTGLFDFQEPTPLPPGLADRRHKVLYSVATAPG